MRRAGLVLLALAVLPGCKREPTFDERYEAAQDKIGKTAREIDADLGRAGDGATPAAEQAPPSSEAGARAGTS